MCNVSHGNPRCNQGAMRRSIWARHPSTLPANAGTVTPTLRGSAEGLLAEVAHVPRLGSRTTGTMCNTPVSTSVRSRSPGHKGISDIWLYGGPQGKLGS